MPIVSQPSPAHPNGTAGTLEIEVSTTGTTKITSVVAKLAKSAYAWVANANPPAPQISTSGQEATWDGGGATYMHVFVDWATATAPGSNYLVEVLEGDNVIMSQSGQLPPDSTAK